MVENDEAEAKLLLIQTISGLQERETSLFCSLCAWAPPSAELRRLVARELALGGWQEDITEGYEAQSTTHFLEENAEWSKSRNQKYWPVNWMSAEVCCRLLSKSSSPLWQCLRPFSCTDCMKRYTTGLSLGILNYGCSPPVLTGAIGYCLERLLKLLLHSCPPLEYQTTPRLLHIHSPLRYVTKETKEIYSKPRNWIEVCQSCIYCFIFIRRWVSTNF